MRLPRATPYDAGSHDVASVDADTTLIAMRLF